MRLQAKAVLVVVAAAVAACPRPHGRPAAVEVQARVEAWYGEGDLAAALAELGLPPPLSEETLAAEAERLAAGADLAALAAGPAVADPGRVVVAPDPARPFVPLAELSERAFHSAPEPGAVGALVQSHGRLIAREPWARVSAAGVVTVRLETVRPVAALGAYFGTPVRADPLGLPRYRSWARGLGGAEPAVDLDLGAILRPRYDVDEVLARGRGELRYRLELLDEESASARLWDGRVAFRCEAAPCGDEPRFVQLPTFRLGPVVDLVGPESATVSFETDAATAAAVLVADGRGEVRRVPSGARGTRHEVLVGGLSPGRRYRYHALAVDGRGEVVWSRGATFRTAPGHGDDEPFSFIMASDCRSGVGPGEERVVGTNAWVLTGLLGRGLAASPRFVLFVGDLVDGFTTEPSAYRFELESWERVVEPFAAHLPFYEAVGNHECLVRAWETGWAADREGDESAEAVFAAAFVNPTNGPAPASPGAPTYLENTYGFDYGPVHVAVVNSDYWFRSHPDRADHPAGDVGRRPGWVDDQTLEWLDRDLAEARERGRTLLVVATHEPAFPCGGHASDSMYWDGRLPEVLEQRDRFVRLLGHHGVDLLFTGHEHNYSRLRLDGTLVPGLERPLWQVISGGAGAPYYAQDRSLPWASRVAAFDARQHLVLGHVEGGRLAVEAISLEGARLDRFETSPAE